MTPERIEQERVKFEKNIHESGITSYKQRLKSGEYAYEHIEFAWEMWQARAAQSEWISVEERLPEVNGTYLGFNNNAGMVGAVKFYKCHTGKGLFHDHRILNVTHWQPLPEPPETRGK